MPELIFRYKTRILKEFDIISTCETYISTSDISKLLKVSEKTVKNDIKELSDFSYEAGSKLISKKHYGYKLEIVDKKRFDEISQKIALYFHFGAASVISSNNYRLLAILQKIVTADSFISVDDLASMFYITSASVTKELKIIKEIVDDYDLKMISYNEKGPMIKGNEYNIRILMLDSLENYHHLNTMFVLEDMYNEYFKMESDKIRRAIRKSFLDKLCSLDIRISDDALNKLEKYLGLIINRHKRGFKLHFTAKQKELITSFSIYEDIKYVFAEFNKVIDYPKDEDEVCGLCLFVMSHLDGDIDPNLYPKRYLFRARNIINKAIEIIKNIHHFDLNELSSAKSRLENCLIPIMLQADMGIVRSKYLNKIGVVNRLNVISNSFAFAVSMAFKAEYGKHLAERYRSLLSLLFSDILLEINYQFKPLNVALVSLLGLNNAQVLKKIFISRFNDFIGSIKTFNLYELRAYDTKAFDVVIINSTTEAIKLGYRYEFPLFNCEQIPSKKDINRFYNEIIIDNINLKEIIREANIPKISFMNNIVASSFEQFYEMMAIKYAKDGDSLDLLKDQLCEIQNECQYDEFVCIFIPISLTEKEFIDIYTFDREAFSNFAIVASLDLSFKAKLRLVRDFFAASIIDKKFFINLIENQDKDIFEKAVRETLKLIPFTLN